MAKLDCTGAIGRRAALRRLKVLLGVSAAAGVAACKPQAAARTAPPAGEPGDPEAALNYR